MPHSLEVYVINLKHEVSRFSHMRSKLGILGINFSRFEAVNGHDLNQNQRLYYSRNHRDRLGLGEIGCLLSHISVWELFSDSDKNFCLILEDDIHFSHDFDQFLDALVATISPDSVEIHRLETFGARVTLKRKPHYRIGDRQAHVLETNHGGAAAYILNKPTARNLISNAEAFRLAIDTELFNPERRQIGDIRVLQWMPAPCIQDMLVGNPVGFISNIDSHRVDGASNSSLKKSKNSIKAFLRPTYTFIYSAFLSLSGRMRKRVLFG